ncbi:HD family phosphohydrolase [Namhaeicola litoreus]|uniref:HD family phosphohydrolase n=1 Tax=Namhaeicola litoreus TaxID=1052145 RepID=A0ABW3Y677_9FLAO
MKELINKYYQNHSLIYKVLLFLITTAVIVYFFPKGGKFKYNLQKGKPWQYENLYAPFDFSIQKSPEELNAEKEEIEKSKQLFFLVKEEVKAEVIESYNKKVDFILKDSLALKMNKARLKNFGEKFINNVYKVGFLNKADNSKIQSNQLITLRLGNEASDILSDNLFTTDELVSSIQQYFTNSSYESLENNFTSLFFEILEPNVFYDEELTNRALEEELKNRSFTKGFVAENERIISKGDMVDASKYEILDSLKKEYDTQLWSKSSYNWIVVGYTILVALVLVMLFLFLKKYRLEIFHNNTKLTFILFNIVLFVFLVTIVQKYFVGYLYVVPIIILPIVLKAFFDARLGLFTHVLTVLLLGFIVPNSFEFVFLQIIAGMVTILTVSELHRRANLFVSILKITLIYTVAYLAFSIIQNGSEQKIQWVYFGMFALNGVLSFLSLFLILIYEKSFGLVSDVSLLELSDTNSTLLRELNEKAPGTFQHSMQVANLAEASANEIGANAMLVRAGALYHDIGKMLNPMYFTENQTTSVSPHHDLSPTDSAKIIRDHVIKGIEMAKKNGLPDRLIDFIRTHHGTNTIYYFYKMQSELTPDQVNIEDFKYPGPIPFSKETAILMMCDSCEAASKSLKTPTALLIDELVEKVINTQMSQGQFMNSDITFKEIQTIKKVIKKKLHNIYHLRIEYPE